MIVMRDCEGRMTIEEVRGLLKDSAQPTISGWAKEHGLWPSYVSDTINGRRDPSPSILKALDLEKIISYRRRQPQ